MKILETERLVIREINSAIDAEFIFEILNTPKFLKYIGDRGVRSVSEAADFIENRYRTSYKDQGFGLYTVELRADNGCTLPTGRVSASGATNQVGMCGFVKREHFEFPDLGFAFLPEHERLGYGYESASAMLRYGRETLEFRTVRAITSQDNDASGKLLEKLGFAYDGIESMPDGETLKIFTIKL